MRLPTLLFLFAASCLSIDAAPAHDEIIHLPGWDDALPSRMYSGYIPAGSDGDIKMYEHYMLVESERSPSTDPVIVWTNGGPGASSLFGLFIELGPFMLSDASLKTEAYNKTGIPSLFYNPYTWTKVANVMILNSPPPVGYSYCDPAGPSGNGTSCGAWNDTRTAVHNAAFLENFIDAFPELKKNDWYIIGESYAGIYVPTLVRQLLDDPQSQVAPLIKGMAIGDGCVGWDVLCGPGGPGPNFHLEFFRGHGQFSDKLYWEVQSTCPRSQLIGPGPITDKACAALLAKVDEEIGGYYAYNLYDTCWYENDLNPPKDWSQPSTRSYWGPPTPNQVKGALTDYPCGGPGALFAWVNTSAVKDALHVPQDAYFFSGDNGVGFNYTLTEKNLLPFYDHLVKNTDIRVLVYNGDTDPGINSFLAQNWTSYLGFPETESWRAWTLDSKQYMGGYVTRYKGDFDFLTIRGSGHMVPEFKPKATLEFLSSWLDNKDWKRYTAPSRTRK